MPMAKTKEKIPQRMLFEENYLIRTYRQLTTNPDIALAELVANAWDAGASCVEININNNEQNKEIITIQDDGVGMTKEEFQKRWRTLAYNRIAHQGTQVEFPNEKQNYKRVAYGRNGIGRHGLLCFADSYVIISKSAKSHEVFSYRISLGTNENLLIFEEIDIDQSSYSSHGTQLSVEVQKNHIGRKKILQSLSRRFLYDPQFKIIVNDEPAGLENLNPLKTITIPVNGFSLEMIILRALGNIEPGIAFWQSGRLVGQPSWMLGSEMIADKRTKTGKDYAVIVKTNDLAKFILEDWSGFRSDCMEELQPVFDNVKEHFIDYCRKINQENYKTTTEGFKDEFSEKLRDSSTLVNLEFEEALREVLQTYPTASHATIKAVLDTVIQLGRKRGGTELLQQIINMEGGEIEKLNNLLHEWTVQEIYVVLDEIDRRIRTIDTIAKLSDDDNTRELEILHPLVTEARWVFGPEFDSPEYTSNQWLLTTAKKLFPTDNLQKLTVPHKRADLVILANSTISLTGTLHSDPQYGDMSLTDRVLLIELKKGRSNIIRQNLSQIEEYADEIYGMSPRKDISVKAFLIGHGIAGNLSDSSRCNGNANIYIRTYSHLVDSARNRLFRLRQSLHDHYENLPDSKLYRGLLPGF